MKGACSEVVNNGEVINCGAVWVCVKDLDSILATILKSDYIDLNFSA